MGATRQATYQTMHYMEGIDLRKIAIFLGRWVLESFVSKLGGLIIGYHGDQLYRIYQVVNDYQAENSKEESTDVELSPPSIEGIVRWCVI